MTELEKGSLWGELASKQGQKQIAYNAINELLLGLPEFLIKTAGGSEAYKELQKERESTKRAADVGKALGFVGGLAVPTGATAKVGAKGLKALGAVKSAEKLDKAVDALRASKTLAGAAGRAATQAVPAALFSSVDAEGKFDAGEALSKAALGTAAGAALDYVPTKAMDVVREKLLPAARKKITGEMLSRVGIDPDEAVMKLGKQSGKVRSGPDIVTEELVPQSAEDVIRQRSFEAMRRPVGGGTVEGVRIRREPLDVDIKRPAFGEAPPSVGARGISVEPRTREIPELPGFTPRETYEVRKRQWRDRTPEEMERAGEIRAANLARSMYRTKKRGGLDITDPNKFMRTVEDFAKIDRSKLKAMDDDDLNDLLVDSLKKGFGVDLKGLNVLGAEGVSRATVGSPDQSADIISRVLANKGVDEHEFSHVLGTLKSYYSAAKRGDEELAKLAFEELSKVGVPGKGSGLIQGPEGAATIAHARDVLTGALPGKGGPTPRSRLMYASQAFGEDVLKAKEVAKELAKDKAAKMEKLLGNLGSVGTGAGLGALGILPGEGDQGLEGAVKGAAIGAGLGALGRSKNVLRVADLLEEAGTKALSSKVAKATPALMGKALARGTGKGADAKITADDVDAMEAAVDPTRESPQGTIDAESADEVQGIPSPKITPAYKRAVLGNLKAIWYKTYASKKVQYPFEQFVADQSRATGGFNPKLSAPILFPGDKKGQLQFQTNLDSLEQLKDLDWDLALDYKYKIDPFKVRSTVEKGVAMAGGDSPMMMSQLEAARLKQRLFVLFRSNSGVTEDKVLNAVMEKVDQLVDSPLSVPDKKRMVLKYVRDYGVDPSVMAVLGVE